MIATVDEFDSVATSASAAHRAAGRNASANLRALRESQPEVADVARALPTNVEWVYARDGSLTALEEGRRWWGGCSLPARAAEFMLKKAELDGTLLCFLYAKHAAQLRTTLMRAKPGQALLALLPDLATLRMVLACDDFSAEIAAHRLYFTAGEQWETQLDELFERLAGLPTPTQFIRPILSDPTPADDMIAPAQKIFAEHSTRRAERVRELRREWKRERDLSRLDEARDLETASGRAAFTEKFYESLPANVISRICVVSPALFRLWDDTGHALAGVMDSIPDGVEARLFNPDDPASASSAALASFAAACDAIVAPNTGRADLPDLLHDDMPWTTWITLPRIPSVEKAGPRDTLLCADPAWKELAIEKGWRAQRVFVARWPGRFPADELEVPAATPGVFRVMPDPTLAIISDTQPLDPPARVEEYSSHRLLWESIRHELSSDPFALGESPEAYLSERMRRARVDDEGFDRAAFLDGVVLHSWQQGIARLLLREKLPLKLHGKGWEALDEFRMYADGAVESRVKLNAAINSAAALIRAWPKPNAHPIDAAGKPVIRARRREAFIRDAKLAIARKYEAPKQDGENLNAATVLRALTVE